MHLSAFILIYVILLSSINGENRILTVEEVAAVRCYQNVAPYQGVYCVRFSSRTSTVS